MRLRECLGAHVESVRGEPIGRTEDLVVDLRDGRILATVVARGGDRLLAVPLSAMTFEPLGKKFILNADRERLRDAPAFERRSWPELSRDWAEEIRSFYRFPPYWE